MLKYIAAIITLVAFILAYFSYSLGFNELGIGFQLATQLGTYVTVKWD